MSLFYSGSRSFTDETEKKKKEQQKQQEQIKQQVESTAAPKNPAKSAPTVQEQYSTAKKKASSGSAISSSGNKETLSEGNGPVRRKPQTIADLPINRLAGADKRTDETRTRGAFMPKNTAFKGAGTELFRNVSRALKGSGKSYRQTAKTKTPGLADVLREAARSSFSAPSRKLPSAEDNEKANRARERLYKPGRGTDFYNNYQLRRSLNRGYTPFAAELDETENTAPGGWKDTNEAPGIGRERERRNAEYTPQRPEYYRFISEPEQIETDRLTDEAKAYIEKGKSKAVSPLDGEKGNITFTYENPLISMYSPARLADPGAGRTEHTVKAKDYMTQEELDIYYYLQGSEDSLTAGAYLEQLKPVLRERALAASTEMQEWRERGRENPVASALAMLPMAFTTGDMRYDIGDAISEGRSAADSGIARLAGDVLQGTAENVPEMLISSVPFVGKPLSAFWGATDAAAEQERRMRREGTEGKTGSAAKLALSAVIGGMEWGALSKAASAPLEAVTKRMTKNALAETLANAAGSFLVGAGVGAAQSSLMTLADGLTMGENSAYERAVKSYKESGLTDEAARRRAARESAEAIAAAALTGGTTGTMMSLPRSVASGIEYRSRGRAVREQGKTDEVLNDGLRFEEQSAAYQNAEKLRSRLRHGYEATDDEIGAQDVLNRVEAAREAQYIREYSELTGQTVREGETPEGVNAYQSGGRIVVAEDTDEPVTSAVRHEGAHGIESAAGESYGAYQSQLRQAEGYDRAVERVRRRYTELGLDYDDSVLESEVAADFARNFLTGVKDMERLRRAAESNTRLTDRVYNGLRTLEAKLRAKGGRRFTDETTGLSVSYTELNAMRRQFETALLEARETGYNDGSLMYSVKRNYDAAKYGVKIDEKVTEFINEAGVNRKLFTAADKSEVKELVRDAYRLMDGGADAEAAETLRRAGDILRTKDPSKYDGEDIAEDFAAAFSELYEEGKENNRAKRTAARAAQDRAEYGLSAAGIIRDAERREGASLDTEEREAFSETLRAAWDDVRNGREREAHERLMPLAETIAERARVKDPAFGGNERELLRTVNSLRLDHGELRISRDANERDVYDRLRRITGAMNGGEKIDRVYGELESRFGKNYFDTEAEQNTLDMLMRVADVYEALRDNEYRPAYDRTQLDEAAADIADGFITEYKRSRPAAGATPEGVRQRDMERYGADIEQPFRDIGMSGATEGDISDLSDMVRGELDAMIDAMKDGVSESSAEAAVKQFDEFAGSFNDRFERLTRSMDMDESDKEAAAQLILSGVCDRADGIVNSYIARLRDTDALFKTGTPRSDGTEVTENEAAAGRAAMAQYRKLQSSIAELKPSRYYTNSGQKPFFTAGTRAEMEARSDEFYYKGITNKETYAAAKRYVEKTGADKTFAELAAKEGWTAEDHARALALTARYQSRGEHSAAVDVISMQRKQYTLAGQAVQSARIIEKLTPEGRFIDVMRQADSFEEKQIDKRGDADIIRNRLKSARELDRRRTSERRQEYNETLRDQDAAMRQLRQTDDEIDGLETRLGDIQRKRTEAQRQIAERGAAEDGGRTEGLARAASEYRELNDRLNALRSERGELQKELQSIERRTETARRRIAEMETDIPNLREDIRGAAGEYGGLSRRLEELTAERKELRDRLGEMQRRRDSAERRITEREAEIPELVSELNEVTEEHGILEDMLRSVTEERSELRKRISAMEKRSETAMRRISERENDVPALRGGLRTVEEEYDILSDMLRSVTEERSELRKRIDSLRGRSETAQRRIAERESDIPRLTAELEKLTEDYEELSAQLRPLIAERNEIRKNLVAMTERRKRLIEGAARSGERLHSAADEVLDAAGIKHIPEHIKEYIHAAFDWIEQLDSVDDLIDIIILPTSKARKTASGRAIKRSLKKAAKKSGGAELMKGIAINQLYGMIEDYAPKSFWSRLSTVHAAGMLLNTTTIIRNIASNAVFTPFETISNEIAVLTDIAMSAFTGNRSVTMENPLRGWTSARRRMRLARLEAALSISGVIDTQSPYTSKRRNFTGRIGTGLERMLSYSLNVTDEWQKGFAEGQVRRSLERAQRASGRRKKNRSLVDEDGGALTYTNDPKRLRRLLRSVTAMNDHDINEVVNEVTDTKRTRRTRYENNITTDDIAEAMRTLSVRDRIDVDDEARAAYVKALSGLSAEEAQEYLKPRTMLTDEDIAELVNEDIRYRTFQDDTLVARVLTASKKAFNEAGTSDFGLGDFIIKFTTVPGNIITRSLEYSPLGYFKAIWLSGKTAVDNMRRGRSLSAAQQRDIALSWARPFTSAGLMAAGAYLRHCGIIVGTSFSAGEDYKESKWEKAKGLGDFQLNLSALERLIKNEDTAAQNGDTLVDVGWIQPVNSTFSLGAAVYDELGAGFIEKMGLADAGLDGEEGWRKALHAPGTYAAAAWEYGKEHMSELSRTILNYGIDQVKDISALQSLYNIAENYDNSEGEISAFMIATATDFGLSFIPQMVKKAGNVLDTETRYPYREKTLGEIAKGKLKAALPYMPWRREVPNSVDMFGDEISSTLGSRWKDIINEYVMPGRLSQYKKTAITDELDRLKEYTTDVLPRTPYKENNVTIDKQKYTFSLYGKDYETYAKLLGQTQTAWLDELINGEYYKYLSENEKTELVSQCVKEAETAVKTYWVYKKGGRSDEELNTFLNDAKSELMSEPAYTIKKKQAANFIKRDGIRVEDYVDAYLQIPYTEFPEELEEKIADLETRIARTKQGTRYKIVNDKRVYSRDWTQAERDEYIAECLEDIEKYRSGAKKKNVDIEGEWKDLTPEQQDKLLWKIDRDIDEIELPEEAISTIPDESWKGYEESGGAINIDETEGFTMDAVETALSDGGDGSGGGGAGSGSSGSGGGSSSGGSSGTLRASASSGGGRRSYSRRYSSGRSGGRSGGSGGSGGVSLARLVPSGSGGSGGAAAARGYTTAPAYGFRSPALGGRRSYADLEPIYTALELRRFVPPIDETRRFVPEPVRDIQRFVPLFNA